MCTILLVVFAYVNLRSCLLLLAGHTIRSKNSLVSTIVMLSHVLLSVTGSRTIPIMITPQSSAANVGDLISLSAHFMLAPGDQLVRLSWQPVVPIAQHRYFVGGAHGSLLTIVPVLASDAGHFTCEIETLYGQGISHAFLDVGKCVCMCPCASPSPPPPITRSESRIRHIEGEGDGAGYHTCAHTCMHMCVYVHMFLFCCRYYSQEPCALCLCSLLLLL